jgi:hypothetical protein
MNLLSTNPTQRTTRRPWLGLAVSLGAVGFTACAQVDQGFAAVNQGVNTLNKAVGLPPVGGATMTPQQQAEFQAQLSVRLQDARVTRARQEGSSQKTENKARLACAE